MNRPGHLGPLAAQAVLRGTDPRLDDFVAAMAEGRRRKRRRGVRSVGAGAALTAVAGVAFTLGGPGSTAARDELDLVDEGRPGVGRAVDDEVERRVQAIPAPLGAPAPTSGRPTGDRPAPSRDAETVLDPVAPHLPAPVSRAQTKSLVPRTCSTNAMWCLQAAAQSRGKGKGYNLASTLCLNATYPFGELDFATAQEADFEILAGSRVIWRWSDGQTFARRPHRLSAMPSECFVWRTTWDQYDGNGVKVGAARLTLRVRSLASQAPGTAASSSFATVPF